MKYCYTTGSRLFCLWANIRCPGGSLLGEKIIVKQDYCIEIYYCICGEHQKPKLYFEKKKKELVVYSSKNYSLFHA